MPQILFNVFYNLIGSRLWYKDDKLKNIGTKTNIGWQTRVDW